MRVRIFTLALFLALLIAGTANAGTLHVAAAANLQKVLSEALIPAFQKSTGITVVPTYGSTKLLGTQIEHGAPIDILIAADSTTNKKLAAKGVISPNSIKPYAVGQLVLWTRQQSPMHPKRIEDLSNPQYSRIAIANPDLAPYGHAAVEAMTKSHLYPGIKPRIVQSENIAQALQFAVSGNADAAFTALSLVINDKKGSYIVIPSSLHSPIVQSAGIVKMSANQTAAQSFINFITSKAAQPIWKRYGYTLP